MESTRKTFWEARADVLQFHTPIDKAAKSCGLSVVLFIIACNDYDNAVVSSISESLSSTMMIAVGAV